MYEKYVDFEISEHESFLNNHPHVRSNKILKLINIIVSGSKLTKDPKIIIFLIDNWVPPEFLVGSVLLDP